jgi:hypothetical protein
MQPTITTLENAVRQLNQDESLLFLNHLLAVSRGHISDSQLQSQLAAIKDRPLVYVVHFLAKQLLMYSSIVGPRILDWPTFVDLMDMHHHLQDPIEVDPNWKHTDPTGFFERKAAQQLASQDRKMIQKYGLALGLFRDVGVVHVPQEFDLRKELEQTLGMSVDEFMAIAQVCGALRAASKGVGTFTPNYLTDAYAQGIKVCSPELWGPFLNRTCCTPQQFRTKQAEYTATDPLFAQFEFDALNRFPIIKILQDRYLAVDPELVVQRATFGLFYDLFEKDRTAFSTKFGHFFEKFIGTLLGTVCQSRSLWSHAQWKESHPAESQKVVGKVSDYAFIGANDTILFECKSLRPSLKLVSIGDEQSVNALTGYIVEALQQLIGHNAEIAKGNWSKAGIPKREASAFVLVMYGQVYTVNGSIWRKHITDRLKSLGLESRPFVVLSLSDFDSVIRLVEVGHPIENVIARLCEREKSLRDYPDLRDDAVSSFAKEKGRAFLSSITPNDVLRDAAAS